jgi:hypothetical protein
VRQLRRHQRLLVTKASRPACSNFLLGESPGSRTESQNNVREHFYWGLWVDNEAVVLDLLLVPVLGLLVLSGCPQKSTQREEHVPSLDARSIVFPKNATHDGIGIRATPNPSPDPTTARDVVFVVQMLPRDEPLEVRVVKYSRDRFNSTSAVAQTLMQLWRLHIESPEPFIMWAEGNDWSIECVIQFKEGKSVRLVTDGWHSCLEDADGYRWFFRISPNEYIRNAVKTYR